jgi:hypothetical protein
MSSRSFRYVPVMQVTDERLDAILKAFIAPIHPG